MKTLQVPRNTLPKHNLESLCYHSVLLIGVKRSYPTPSSHTLHSWAEYMHHLEYLSTFFHSNTKQATLCHHSTSTRRLCLIPQVKIVEGDLQDSHKHLTVEEVNAQLNATLPGLERGLEDILFNAQVRSPSLLQLTTEAI